MTLEIIINNYICFFRICIIILLWACFIWDLSFLSFWFSINSFRIRYIWFTWRFTWRFTWSLAWSFTWFLNMGRLMRFDWVCMRFDRSSWSTICESNIKIIIWSIIILNNNDCSYIIIASWNQNNSIFSIFKFLLLVLL